MSRADCGKRVLVVDDHSDNVFLLSQLLRRSGYVIEAARDGLEALERVRDFEPDLMLLDIMMPKLDGLEVCRRLKGQASTEQIAILLLSAITDESQRVEGLDAGADDYVTKPYSPRELLARVRAQLRVKERRDDLASRNAKLQEIAIRDSLTGLFNRGYFDGRLRIELERAKRYHHSLSLLIMDLDHFKAINDQYGHTGGDQVLRAVARIVRGAVRRVDVAARYGGEEFVVILPETSSEEARALTDRLRRKIKESVMQLGEARFTVTMSGGVATLDASRNDPEALLRAADRALYEAKRSGRDRIEIAADD